MTATKFIVFFFICIGIVIIGEVLIGFRKKTIKIMGRIYLVLGFVGLFFVFFILIRGICSSPVEFKEPIISTGRLELICVSDTNVVKGSIEGRGKRVYGILTAGNSYQYYYQKEDGGIIQGAVPANSTTIYYHEDEDNKAYLETITTTRYFKTIFENVITREEITYKLYIPEGSISGYELDAE